MPKIDINSIASKVGASYPSPFDEPCKSRARQALGDAGGLSDFGVNLLTLPPGAWSSQRHWHSHEDEFAIVISGEVTLIEDDGETILRAGDCAAFPKGVSNGHHIINHTSATAIVLEAGSRHKNDDVTYSDIDMLFDSAKDQFVHKDGTPY